MTHICTLVHTYVHISLVNCLVAPTSVCCNVGSLGMFITLTYICMYLGTYFPTYHYGIPNCIHVCTYLSMYYGIDLYFRNVTMEEFPWDVLIVLNSIFLIKLCHLFHKCD